MAKHQWTEKYSVFVPDMDQQHQLLLQLLGDLEDIVSREHKSEEVGEALKKIIRMSEIHFEAEEKLMRAHQFPGARAHEAVHREVIRHMQEDILLPIARSQIEITPERVQAAALMVVEHVTTEDKKYGAYIAARRPVGT